MKENIIADFLNEKKKIRKGMKIYRMQSFEARFLFGTMREMGIVWVHCFRNKRRARCFVRRYAQTDRQTGRARNGLLSVLLFVINTGVTVASVTRPETYVPARHNPYRAVMITIVINASLPSDQSDRFYLIINFPHNSI